jgi:ABC-type bacteriocin/lantibiotic exporter with double-glycine peptidase domain
MIKLKPFEQSPGLCGPASLKMVLDYYGRPVTENELAKVSGATREKGVSLEGLVKAAKHFGFHTFYKEESSFDDIRYFIKRDIPVIVSWFSIFGGSYDGHFSVVIDIDKEKITLRDPYPEKIFTYAKKRQLSLDDFRKLWFDFEGDFIKSQKDLLLRQILVVTPFKEKFPLKSKKRNKRPIKKIEQSKIEINNQNKEVDELTKNKQQINNN